MGSWLDPSFPTFTGSSGVGHWPCWDLISALEMDYKHSLGAKLTNGKNLGG
jgi:hypothetical protein